MKKEIIVVAEDFTIFREDRISDDVENLLKKVTWGTRETLYDRLDTISYLRDQHGPTILTVEKEGKVYACAMFSKRVVTCIGKQFSSYFVRYFAADPELRGTGMISKYSASTMKTIRVGEKEPTIYQALVEKKNKSSIRNVEKVDFKLIASISTIGFSRFFPKKANGFERLPVSEQPLILDKLSAQYENYNFVQFLSAFKNNDYFVIRDKGEIKAGAQVFFSRWVVKALPGRTGKFILRVAPKIPILNRVFNPKKFHFISFDSVYCPEGNEDYLIKLKESCLAQFNVNAGMSWMDERSSITIGLKKSGKLGILERFMGNSGAYFYIATENIDENLVDAMAGSPVYISAFDCV